MREENGGSHVGVEEVLRVFLDKGLSGGRSGVGMRDLEVGQVRLRMVRKGLRGMGVIP